MSPGTARVLRHAPPAMLTLLAGCGGGLGPMPIPAGLAPADATEAARGGASPRPAGNRDIRVRRRVPDEGGSVAGDTALWADPEKDVEKLVPDYPLFWAMLGIARAPVPGGSVRSYSDSAVTAWQFASGGDTVEYVREHGQAGRLIAEVRRAGKRVGRVETRFGPDGLPLSARLVVTSRPARLDLTFYQNRKATTFAADTWVRPAPAQR